MYDYITPAGFGDTFYVYTVNGEDIPLTNGGAYTLIGIPVEDSMFVCRVWTGAMRILAAGGTVQVYDGVKCAWFQLPVLQSQIFPSGLAVLPEKVYRNNSALRFDLLDAQLAVNSNGTASVYADQMGFLGVKRLEGGPSDPAPSEYRYYEKPFSYPLTVQLTNYGPSDGGGNPIAGLSAPTQYQQLVQDYDFELRRIIMSSSGGTGGVSVVLANEEGNALQVASANGGSGTFQLLGSNTPNVPFSISVVAGVIIVTLGTDNSGNVTTTLADLINIINTTPASAAIAFATELEPGGSFGLPAYPTGHEPFSPGSGGVSPYASPFKITLYDATWRSRSNIPLLAEFLCRNVANTSPVSNAPNNAWPSPPMLYPVNSVIRFDIFSLIPTGDSLPVTVQLLFDGVRRIAC